MTLSLDLVEKYRNTDAKAVKDEANCESQSSDLFTIAEIDHSAKGNKQELGRLQRAIKIAAIAHRQALSAARDGAIAESLFYRLLVPDQ